MSVRRLQKAEDDLQTTAGLQAVGQTLQQVGSEPCGALGGLGEAEHSYPPGRPPPPSSLRPGGQSGVFTGPAPKSCVFEQSLVIQVATQTSTQRPRTVVEPMRRTTSLRVMLFSFRRSTKSDNKYLCPLPLPPPLRSHPPPTKNQVRFCFTTSSRNFAVCRLRLFLDKILSTLMCFHFDEQKLL